ncbi:hypothetical protein Z946_693 [Sulfitobacter noctilucicola]|nr:hypothetical protein Z946_1127 [Sulfitobacter noctilucicola]KIN65968.1 hypothetical protein Z946_693 [Sulfitobacter noctilucicola]
MERPFVFLEQPSRHLALVIFSSRGKDTATRRRTGNNADVLLLIQ